MRSYARNISTLAKKTNILADITASGDITISMDTYDDYVEALENCMSFRTLMPGVRP